MVARLSRAASIALARALTFGETSSQASSKASKITFRSSGGNAAPAMNWRAFTRYPVAMLAAKLSLGAMLVNAAGVQISRVPARQAGGVAEDAALVLGPAAVRKLAALQLEDPGTLGAHQGTLAGGQHLGVVGAGE